ncbi:MAG: Na+/H+ antiporter subunit G [Rhodobacteraceae bacterium]|nr:Na+/H+ antiporter subunit G [Paracoccaceae bacterium]
MFFDVLICALLVIGSAFALVGSWGFAKLNDFYKRIHGPTKASTLGVGCLLLASALYFGTLSGEPDLRPALIAIFLFITAPVSAHLLVKSVLAARKADRPPPPIATAPARD